MSVLLDIEHMNAHRVFNIHVMVTRGASHHKGVVILQKRFVDVS